MGVPDAPRTGWAGAATTGRWGGGGDGAGRADISIFPLSHKPNEEATKLSSPQALPKRVTMIYTFYMVVILHMF